MNLRVEVQKPVFDKPMEPWWYTGLLDFYNAYVQEAMKDQYNEVKVVWSPVEGERCVESEGNWTRFSCVYHIDGIEKALGDAFSEWSRY